MKVYLVGGAVRDKLLGRPVQEKDYVVVGSSPEAMLARGFKPVGKDFPVFLHPETKQEYALARSERKSGRGYAGFTFYTDPSVTLEQDLLRRDLTINAMAMDETGTIVDPYGGQDDLRNKVLRHVSPAFIEDPVRILRIARFMSRYAPLGFSIAPETLSLMYQMVESGELDALVPERVWQEWQNAFAEAAPEAFIETLRACGALKIIFPEIDGLFGVPSRPSYHPEIDTGIHVLMVLKYACHLSADPKVRVAALLHDLGKAKTPPQGWPSHKGHEAAGMVMIDALAERYKMPKDYRELAKLVSKYHLHVHTVETLRPDTLLDLLESLDVFRRPDRFFDFIMACKADFYGRIGFEEKPYPQYDYLMKAYERVKQAGEKIIKTCQSLTGEEIKIQLRKARLASLKAMKTA